MPNIEEILRENLTEHQFNAAMDDSLDILCLACAGSGKSRTLAFRIARLIAEDKNPKSIVAFTFTEKASESIKHQVIKALTAVDMSPALIGAMYIGTIHSYCKNVLSAMDARYRQFEVLDENRLKLYLISRYATLGLRNIRVAMGNRRFFETIREVYNAWSLINDEMITIEEVSTHNETLGEVLENLRNSLNRDNYYDFSLMIRLVVEGLNNNNSGALRAIEEVKYLMVDEYQDVNPAQETLIRAIHNNLDSLFVVGDDDQSIYAWRGADVSNILDFPFRYHDCSQHTISENFRSTSTIVRVSDRFVADELGPTRYLKNPTAREKVGSRDFRVLWFNNREEEAQWVAHRIEDLIGTEYHENDGTIRGLTPADFAILMRSTRTPEQDGRARHFAFTEALENRGIEYSLEAGGSIFDRPQIRALKETFELLRHGSPDRIQTQRFFEQEILPPYPEADFNLFADTLRNWSRLIHAPISGVRRRIYPQQLVHDLLHAFAIKNMNFDAGVMNDLGVFSRIILDVETVYMSIDSTHRFHDILNFLQNVAIEGYNSSTDDIFLRPDLVTVSTVHKVKGLEFPVVFIVDVESQRFPGRRYDYRGWIPREVIEDAIGRGAFQSTIQEEARLFYTALTRSERYLYVTGAENLPNARSQRRESPFSQRLEDPEISTEQEGLPVGLVDCGPQRRIDETVIPTSYSDIRYYLRCPKDYQFRKSYGFSPPVPDLFGFGMTVHCAVGKLHEVYDERAPNSEETEDIGNDIFHLKHVPQSNDPENNPGPYERAKDRALDILKDYTESYGDDFEYERQVELPFEVPIRNAVISGSIDLILRLDENGEIIGVKVIDFKTLEGGEEPEINEQLVWTELALQVQLYVKVAIVVLGENAKTGAVHLLKDSNRIRVPINSKAISAAVKNVEWAVDQIISGDFPMRPQQNKCEICDFRALCSKVPEYFSSNEVPPPIHIPGPEQLRMVSCFSEFEEDDR